jgi:hypothetical protein
VTLDEATRRLERWTQSLLDLTPRDRLIDRADADEAIAFSSLDPVAVAAALRAGRALGLIGSSAADDAAADALSAGVVPTALDAAELARRLTAITRAARRGRAEGDHVTWLALGVLWWTPGDARVRRAPLLLLPVECRRTASGFAIAQAGAVRLNLALVEAVRREAEVELPIVEAEPVDVGATLAAIAARIAEVRPAWAVERASYLTTVSLAGVAMWNDLARAELIAGSPLFRRMLGSEPALPVPVLPVPALALDADAEQAAVAAAALAGHSVAVLAPPGTGAAQTAANVIAAAIADGRSVLVVANRTAALRAVKTHLASIGLAEFALSLDVLADARKIAATLAGVAGRSWRPGVAALGAIDRRDAIATALDVYADALHAPTALGISMHDAVAKLVELRTSPRLLPAAIDLAGLDPGELARRRAVIASYTVAATAVAPIAAHPWRASSLAELPPPVAATETTPEVDPIVDALDVAARSADELGRRIAALRALIPGLAPRTRADLDAAGRLFAIAAKTPRPGADLIAAGPAPAEREVRVDPTRALPASAIPRDPAAYVALARRQRKLRDELAQRWTPGIAELDLDGLAAKFRAWNGKFGPWRYFALRDAHAEVRAVLAGAKLPDDLTVAADLDTAAEERAARRLLGEAAGPARRWFGQLAARDANDLPDLDALELDQVDAALWWARELRAAFDAVPIAGSRDAAWRALVAQVCAPHASATRVDAPVELVDPEFADAAAAVDAWQKALAGLADAAGVDPAVIDGDRGHLAALADQVAAWQRSLVHLPAWTAYVRARSAARAAGLAPVVSACESGELATDQAADAWERAVLLAVIGDRIAAAPSLAQFHGPSHHARASELGELTRAAQLAVRSRSLARLAERVPRPGRDGDGTGDCDAIARELARPAAGRTRDLLIEVAPVLARLAPCVLASPAAVATHLDPTLPPFDLVVILEAGAMPTAMALGALARARAAIVLGRPAEGAVFADAAERFPTRRLAIHDRSRHEDLISFTSKRWFDDRLHVFPAPIASPATLGVAWRGVEGDPADAIVAAVLVHLRDPERRRRSLAVIGFDRELLARIEDRLDAIRAGDPVIERCFADPDPGADEPGEPVLIADAAIVDGDARDVVLLAIECAFDADRSLITAVTRAREQLIVMSAIEPDAATGDLAALLAFARAGGSPAIEDAPPASPMCAAIAAALTARGWSVRHQVGTGPYRIDLAVVDPDEPGRYVLAIETDGPAYGSAATAGDRDRLRPQILAGLGWRLHRVWCLDWWTDPDREAQRANGAVIAAIAAARQSRRVGQPRSSGRWHRTEPTIAIDSGPTASVGVAAAADAAPSAAGSAAGSAPRSARGSRPTAARSPQLLLGLAGRMSPAVAPYQAASVPAGRRRPDDMFESRHAEELGKLIDRVLEIEAPIHLGLLARRVGAYFGVGRVTPKITDQVRAAIVGHGQIAGDEPDVIWRLDQDPAGPIPVRVAAETIDSKRDIDDIPLVEIAGAAAVVVDRASTVGVPDLVRDSARLLGFARITDRVIDRVRTGVELAGTSGVIKIDGDRATRS